MIKFAPISVASFSFAIALLGGCAGTSMSGTGEVVAAAELSNTSGGVAGEARVVRQGTRLTLKLSASGLTPGQHGLHFHAVGRCEGPGFTSAGPHLNPGARQHGHDNPAGAHLGDLPNITADAAGRVTADMPLALEPDAPAAALFDGDGSAIVVHAKGDDYRTDPSGNSGERIACGVLRAGGKN